MTMTPPGSTAILASRRVPSETDRMIERMRTSDYDEITVGDPSSPSSPKAGSSNGRPPRAPTSARTLANNGSKSKSTSRRDRRKPMEEEERGGGVVSSILSKIDASIASVTTCIIPGAQCGDIEQGDFDLGRIDDLARGLYTRVAGGGGKKTPQQTATFDDDNTLSSETQTLATFDTGADTGYYTGYTGATGLTEGTAASINTSARSQCESTVGKNAHRANANNNDCEYDDLVGDDDDTIKDGKSTGMARSSTFQTTLTMNTLNSVSTIGTSGTGGVGSTVGTSKIPTMDSAVNTITAIGIDDTGGMRYESADMGTTGSEPVRQRTQSTNRSEKTEPTRSNRSSAAVRNEHGSPVCVGESTSTGIELELGKEPRNMPSTAVDIDECSVNDDEEGLDAIGAAVAKHEIQYNITYVQQNEPLVVEQSLDEPLASRCSGYSREVERGGQEISFDSFKAGLEESLNDGKDEQSFADDEGLVLELMEAANELDNKDSKGLVVAKTKSANSNADGRRISSEKKKVKKPPFFAAPPISSNKDVPPPPFFATSTSSRKSKAGEKRSTTVQKETTSADLDTTAETVDLESCAEI